MSDYKLSFVISTKNRLPFLKILFAHLLPYIKDDEEIVVVDSDSTDGSKEYLQELYTAKKIQQFISEPDKNQAHGWNKAFMLAKGEIIKKLIDDDVFCYDAIRACKNHLLLNPDIDVIISNELGSEIGDHKNIHRSSALPRFEKWNAGLVPSFPFGDVHILIRRSCLPYIGLYHTAYVMMDWEYSLRISYLKSNIVYYTGYNALSVSHPQSVSALKDLELITVQGDRGKIFYEYGGDRAGISLWSEVKIFIGKHLFKQKKTIQKVVSESDMETIYNYYYEYISDLNNSETFAFLGKA